MEFVQSVFYHKKGITMVNRTYWTKRPTLADRLFASGEMGRCVIDTFDNNRKRWVFDTTVTGLSIVLDYYKEIGKPLPKQYETLYNEIVKEKKA